MPETENSQTSESTTPAPFVTLGAGDEPLAPDTDEATTEATETAAGDTSATDADEATETPEPPSAESVGLDLKDPKQKAAYGEMVKQWGKWTQRFHSKQKATEPAPQQPVQQQAQQPAQSQAESEWDPYTVPLSDFKYTGEAEAEGSELAGFETAIDRRIEAGVKKAIEFTLNQMRVNDGRLRQQQQVGTAREQIESYIGSVSEHPDYAEKQAVFAEIANKPWARQMAVEDPEAFITMLEEKSGISRNWQQASEREQVQRGQQNQRLATKPLAVVSRPTRSAPTPTPSAGNMTFGHALEKAMKARLG